MSLKEDPAEIRLNVAVSHWTSYLLIAAMIACSALTVGSFVQRMMADWQPWLMAAVCFVVALDGLFIHHRMKNEKIHGSSWLAVVSVQMVVIFLLVKIVMGLSHGLQAFLTEISLWNKGFMGNFITFDLLIALVMAVIAWFFSGHFGELLDRMSMEQAVMDQAIEVPDKRAEPQARDSLLNLIFSTLIILVMFTALARVDLNVLSSGSLRSFFYPLPPLAGGGASTLAFFMLGLALFSQTQFISLHTRWNLAHIPVSSRLGGRWALYSIVFLLILAVIAGLLPTHYSMGLLSSLGALLDVFSQFFFILLQVIFLPLALLINLPFLLLGKTPPIANNILPTPDIQPAPQQPTPIFLPWLELIKSLVFWTAFLGITFYALNQYLRQHKEVLSGLRRIPGWRYLSGFWSWLRSMWKRAGTSLSRVMENGRLRSVNVTRRPAAGGGFLNLRRLNPRQRIYFYYLSLVRRGGEHGFPRQPSQTPSEYAQSLDDALPAIEADIDQLTEAFIEARYSRHDVRQQDAKLVKNTWERIRHTLTGKRKLPPG